MLKKETLLGRVQVQQLPGNKIGLPIPASIDRSWVMKDRKFYAECLYDENAILVTPNKSSIELPRSKVQVNSSHDCFVINSLIAMNLDVNVYGDDSENNSVFEIYRCYEKKLNFKAEVERSNNPFTPTCKFEFFEQFTEENLLELLKLFPTSNICVNAYERVDALYYKLCPGNTL